jgi:hypothetical protein
MFRFTIRDVLWLMVVAGLGLALLIQREQTFLMRSAWEYELSRNLSAVLKRHTSMDLVEMPLRDVARYISETHGYECVLSKDVDDSIPLTGKYPSMPLGSLLTELLAPHNLAVRATDSQIIIENVKSKSRP